MLKNPESFFRRLGANVRDLYRKHIFTDAKDVYDKSFSKIYSEGYTEIKKQKQQGGYKLNAPVLRGDLRLDFGSHFKPSANGFEIGWASQGAKIKWLKKRGRVLTDSKQAFPKGIVEYMSKELTKQYKKENPNKTTIHNLGKK